MNLSTPLQIIPPKDADRRRIYLMRHGSVTYFDPLGKPLEPTQVPLNQDGQAQADAAGRAFAAAGVRFDRVLISGLPRTQQTAQRVLAQMGAAAQSIQLEHVPDWVEIKGEELSKIPDDQLQAAFCGALDGMVEHSAQFLGGESIAQLLARVIPPLHALRAQSDWDVVLIVLHGGVNRALLSSLIMGQPQFYGGLAQGPACINAVDVGSHLHDTVLRLVNYCPVDPVQTSTRKTTMEALLEKYKKYRLRLTNV